MVMSTRFIALQLEFVIQDDTLIYIRVIYIYGQQMWLPKIPGYGMSIISTNISADHEKATHVT